MLTFSEQVFYRCETSFFEQDYGMSIQSYFIFAGSLISLSIPQFVAFYRLKSVGQT